MLYRAITSIFIISFFCFASTQEQALVSSTKPKIEEYIDWSTSKKLTWEDYLGKIDDASDAAATTSTLLGIEYNFKNDVLQHKIICRFSRLKSWGRHKTDYILAHEQCHFDITEVYARKLNKALYDYKFNPGTYKSDLNNIYNEIVREKQAMQDLYDRETDHSRNKSKQMEWLKKIEEVIAASESYADYN